MRYQVKRARAVSRMLALLFCIALLLAELNTPGMDGIPEQEYLALTGGVPKGHFHPKKNDAIAEFPGTVEEDAMGEILADGFSRFFFRSLPIKYLVMNKIFLFVPMVLWSERTVLMQEGYVSRKYLMGYIHDSDGEKGIPAGILMAN
ncbi:hypothetical protein [Lacrimispora brassicae]